MHERAKTVVSNTTPLIALAAALGSLDVLIKAKQQGFPIDMKLAISNMSQHGIWLSKSLIDFALSH